MHDSASDIKSIDVEIAVGACDSVLGGVAKGLPLISTLLVQSLEQPHVHYRSCPLLVEFMKRLVKLEESEKEYVALATQPPQLSYAQDEELFQVTIRNMRDARKQMTRWIDEVVGILAITVDESTDSGTLGTCVQIATDCALSARDCEECEGELDEGRRLTVCGTERHFSKPIDRSHKFGGPCEHYHMGNRCEPEDNSFFSGPVRCYWHENSNGSSGHPAPFLDSSIKFPHGEGITTAYIEDNQVLHEWSCRYHLDRKDASEAGPSFQMLLSNGKLKQIIFMNNFNRKEQWPLEEGFPCHGTSSDGSAVIVRFNTPEHSTKSSTDEVIVTTCPLWKYDIDAGDQAYLQCLKFEALKASICHFALPINSDGDPNARTVMICSNGEKVRVGMFTCNTMTFSTECLGRSHVAIYVADSSCRDMNGFSGVPQWEYFTVDPCCCNSQPVFARIERNRTVDGFRKIAGALVTMKKGDSETAPHHANYSLEDVELCVECHPAEWCQLRCLHDWSMNLYVWKRAQEDSFHDILSGWASRMAFPDVVSRRAFNVKHAWHTNFTRQAMRLLAKKGQEAKALVRKMQDMERRREHLQAEALEAQRKEDFMKEESARKAEELRMAEEKLAQKKKKEAQRKRDKRGSRKTGRGGGGGNNGSSEDSTPPVSPMLTSKKKANESKAKCGKVLSFGVPAKHNDRADQPGECQFHEVKAASGFVDMTDIDYLKHLMDFQLRHACILEWQARRLGMPESEVIAEDILKRIATLKKTVEKECGMAEPRVQKCYRFVCGLDGQCKRYEADLKAMSRRKKEQEGMVKADAIRMWLLNKFEHVSMRMGKGKQGRLWQRGRGKGGHGRKGGN